MKYSMKDGGILKKIFISLLVFFILPQTLLAKKIDKDINSGIILSSEDDIIPNDTVLSVTNINNNNITSTIKSFGLTDYKAYNISLLNNNTRIIPNGEVTLSFPIPKNYNTNLPKQIFVLKLGNNNIDTIYATSQDDIGLYEELTIDNGYAIINTSDFSLNDDTIYLIGTTQTINNNVNNTTKLTTTTVNNNPKTLDNDFAPLLVVSIIAIGGIMLLFTKLYLDNKN